MAHKGSSKLRNSSVWSSVLFSVKTVLAHEPKLLILGIFDELITRTKSLVEVFIFARIVTLLPGLLDEITRDATLSSIAYLLIGFLLLEIFITIESALFRIYQHKHKIILEAKLESALMYKFASVPYAKYEDKKFIDRYDLASNHLSMIQDFVLWRLRGILGTVYTVIATAVLLISFSWILAILLLGVALPQLIIEMRLNRAQRKIWRETTANRRKANAFRGLLHPRSIKDTRLFGLTDHAITGYVTHQQYSEREQLKLDGEVNRYRIALDSLLSIMTVSALGYTVFMIARGAAPLGQFVFVQQLVSQYSNALSALVWEIQVLDEFLEGAEDFKDFMQGPTSPASTIQAPANATITFDNVSFRYPQANRPAIHDISFKLEPGKTYAFVGSNGAGKTTLLKLLMNLYVPTAGEVTVGTYRLRDINEQSWHRKIGILFQDFVSFWDFTIRDNVRFGDIDTNDNVKIATALVAARAKGFVDKLPKKNETYLGKIIDEKHGIELSGGQLQRLAIARILFRDPEILIMDEPTSAVDAEAEFEIFQEINKSRQNKTTILVSHRFSTVRSADYIFVMKDGTIVEQGSHDELMQQAGMYNQLFNLQAEGYK